MYPQFVLTMSDFYHANMVHFFVVHDGINSVADYNSLRVGVGWMSDVVCRMSYVCRISLCKFHDWITSKRLEILS